MACEGSHNLCTVCSAQSSVCMLATMTMHCLLADVAEASSSSHNMQDDTTALQGCAASWTSAWGDPGHSPLSFTNLSLRVPDSTSMDADLDAYGSGISSGMPTASGAPSNTQLYL